MSGYNSKRQMAQDKVVEPAQEPDWKDQYEKQKRRAEMWIAKYEKDIGPLEKAAPVAQPAQEPVMQEKIHALKPMLEALRIKQVVSFSESQNLLVEVANKSGMLPPAFEISGNQWCALVNLAVARFGNNALLVQPSQEPVAWGYRNPDGAIYDCISPEAHADAEGDYTIPLYTAPKEALEQPEQEPFEYWNAVEGWVKIDEMREHFGSVGCGTIYKTAGEDRVPLYTAPQQRPWVGLTAQEAADCWTTSASKTWHNLEAKLKEKNFD